MNKVILMGRLTKAPKIKYLQDDNKTAMARYMQILLERYAYSEIGGTFILI